MLPPWKRLLLRATILGGPFAILFLAIKVGAPALAEFKERRLAGAAYATHHIVGEGATYQVFLAGDRERASVLARALDAYLLEAAARGREPFGLAAPGKRVALKLYRTKDELVENARFRLHIDDLRYNGGFFSPAERAIYLHDERDAGAIARGLRHEGAHLLFADASQGSLSPWLAEGLACYYEDALGPDAALRLRAKAREALEGPPALAALFGAASAAFRSEGNDRLYRDAHLVVAWFLEAAPAPARAQFVAHVREEMAHGALPPDALARRLETDGAELEAAVCEWLRALAAL